jgi:hypothetical protein
MANVNTIAIDLVGGTATLTVTNSGNPVDTITYTDATKVLSFANRSLINISGADFLNYLQQFAVFQQAILNNFSPNINTSVPYTETDFNENNNTGSSSWDFYAVCGYAPLGRLVDYSALSSNSTVNVKNRQFTLTANFNEWLNLLLALLHYKQSVKTFLNI